MWICFKSCLIVLVVAFVSCYPSDYRTENFEFGIKYESSVPMTAGSDRLRHKGNYDPFAIVLTATAKSNHVIDYMQVSVTGDADSNITFCVLRGEPGWTTIVFHLQVNNSDFISYVYKTYGLPIPSYEKNTDAANYTGVGGC